jgi:hypothetical protein
MPFCLEETTSFVYDLVCLPRGPSSKWAGPREDHRLVPDTAAYTLLPDLVNFRPSFTALVSANIHFIRKMLRVILVHLWCIFGGCDIIFKIIVKFKIIIINF